MAEAIACCDYDPDTREKLHMGEDRISRYMAEHGVGFPEAVEALARARQAEFAELAATYAEIHGLDDEQTLFALWAHGIDGPARAQ
jgi:hypothetical protein